MAVLSTIAVAALAVSGSLNGNIIVKETYSFYDPLGYTEYNLINNTNEFSYNDYVSDLIEQENVCEQTTVHVLTHGMGGDASHWLVKSQNSPTFLKTDYSLPFALAESDLRKNEYGTSIIQNSDQIYKFSYNSSTHTTELYKLTPNNVENEEFHFQLSNSFEEKAIESQIVLIYEGEMGQNIGNITDQDCYEIFRSNLNTVLSGISIIFNGILPKINLIGHSRGGLINLLYAHDYPELVNNLISLGTPYVGSDWADLFVTSNKLFMQNEDFTGYDDMLNISHASIYSNYLEEINDNVNTFAIGFKQTDTYFANTILQVLSNNPNLISDLAENVVEVFPQLPEEDVIELFDNIVDILLNIGIYFAEDLTNSTEFAFISYATQIFGTIFNNSELTSFSNFLRDLDSVINTDVKFDSLRNSYIIESDTCVNLNSQIGYSRNMVTPIYDFDRTEIILLGEETNNSYYDFSHCSDPNNKWIAHNFETKNPFAKNIILDFLNENDGFHEHNYINYSTNTTHEMKCYCGIISLEEEPHTLTYEFCNEATHRYHCSSIDCSYQIISSHSFRYSFLNIYTHEKQCQDCGYFVNNEEHLMNVYIPDDLHTHTSYCSCGALGISSEHNVSYFTGKCMQCNLPITTPNIPPVIPPIGPTPIN